MRDSCGGRASFRPIADLSVGTFGDSGSFSILSPEYALLDGATRIGSLVRPSYVRPAQVEVSVDTPLAAQVFLLWLVAVLWKWQVA